MYHDVPERRGIRLDQKVVDGQHWRYIRLSNELRNTEEEDWKQVETAERKYLIHEMERSEGRLARQASLFLKSKNMTAGGQMRKRWTVIESERVKVTKVK
jgi:hypothetical protein